MDDKEYIRQLEERIIALENKLNNIGIGTNGSIIMNQCSVHNLETRHDCHIKLEQCSVGDIQIGRDSDIKIKDCSVGTAINCDVDEGEDRIEELEGV